MRISDWSSDVCSSDLVDRLLRGRQLELAGAAHTVALRVRRPAHRDGVGGKQPLSLEFAARGEDAAGRTVARPGDRTADRHQARRMPVGTERRAAAHAGAGTGTNGRVAEREKGGWAGRV